MERIRLADTVPFPETEIAAAEAVLRTDKSSGQKARRSADRLLCNMRKLLDVRDIDAVIKCWWSCTPTSPRGWKTTVKLREAMVSALNAYAYFLQGAKKA